MKNTKVKELRREERKRYACCVVRRSTTDRSDQTQKWIDRRFGWIFCAAAVGEDLTRKRWKKRGDGAARGSDAGHQGHAVRGVAHVGAGRGVRSRRCASLCSGALSPIPGSPIHSLAFVASASALWALGRFLSWFANRGIRVPFA